RSCQSLFTRIPRPPTPTLFPYTTLFRSPPRRRPQGVGSPQVRQGGQGHLQVPGPSGLLPGPRAPPGRRRGGSGPGPAGPRGGDRPPFAERARGQVGVGPPAPALPPPRPLVLRPPHPAAPGLSPFRRRTTPPRVV